MPVDWETTSKANGYCSTTEMLADLYYTKGLSLGQISKVIYVGVSTIKNKMNELRFPRFPKGRRNQKGIPCPNCGHLFSATSSTHLYRKYKDSVIRIRMCANCGERFQTIESLKGVKNGRLYI